MRRATKQKFKISIIISIVALVVLSVAIKNKALATVPVEVMKGTLTTVKTVENVSKISDIDDADNKADIQSFISGNYDPTGTASDVHNVTVTQTQKLVGTKDDISNILAATAKNISDRKIELTAQLKAENAKTKKDQEVIDRLTNSITDLTNVETRLTAIKLTDLKETIALDVNIVKNTAKTIDDLQSIAKEELARKEVSKLTDQVQNAFNGAGFVTNWHDFSVIDPATTSAQFITKNFSTGTMQLPLLDPATQSKAANYIQKRAIQSVQSSYTNLTLPKKDFTATTFDQLNYGSWDDLITLSYPSNNLWGQTLAAEIAAKEVADEKAYENEMEAITGQGVLSQKQPTGTTASNGLPNTKIIQPGSLIKSSMDSALQAEYSLRVDPKYASPESATHLPGVPSNIILPTNYQNINGTKDTYRTGLPPVEHDAASGGSSLGNVRWDTSYGSMVKSVTGFDLCSYVKMADPTITTCGSSLKQMCIDMTTDIALAAKVKGMGFDLKNICGMVSSITKGFSLNDLFNNISGLFHF